MEPGYKTGRCFFSKAAARRHARFETVTLGKFKESVVTYVSNKRERGKMPFGFALTFLGILPTGFRGRGPLRLGLMSFLYILILQYKKLHICIPVVPDGW